MKDNRKYDVAIIGGGIAGFSTALRLQNNGFQTIVLEAHGQLGGCAGFFKTKGFSFDVGATTLVDFGEEGVGGLFLKEIGLDLLEGEFIDYVAWLPDRKITLYRDKAQWKVERLEKLGSTNNHIKFWELVDNVTEVFWRASRNGIKLPLQSIKDVFTNINAIGLSNIYLAKYLNLTIYDVLEQFNLQHDTALKGFLSMLIEDTIHSKIEDAPFINSALGSTIRGAGLMRAKGGMYSFWKRLEYRYLELGGVIKKGNKVSQIEKRETIWQIHTNKSTFFANKIISAIPLDLTYLISPCEIQLKLQKYIKNNEKYQGSAVVMFLGVPEEEINNQELTHHQLLIDYDLELGNGNNMFISVSASDDTIAAPIGFRSVMISSHTTISEWQNLNPEEYNSKKELIGCQLLSYAQKVYPNLANNAIVHLMGTPLTYQKFTHRRNGSVGGFKQNIKNSNLYSVPQDIGFEDFWLVGDNTWPGLGTVAALISSKIVAKKIKK